LLAILALASGNGCKHILVLIKAQFGRDG